MFNKTNTKIAEMTRRIEKLERIIKYSADYPTYRIEEGYMVKNLYIYYGKDEYIIPLNGVAGRIDLDSIDLYIEDDLAYLKFISQDRCSIYNFKHRYKYVINFKEMKYLRQEIE